MVLFPKTFNWFPFPIFHLEFTWWRLFQRRALDNSLGIYGFVHFYSADGLSVPDGIIRPVVGCQRRNGLLELLIIEIYGSYISNCRWNKDYFTSGMSDNGRFLLCYFCYSIFTTLFLLSNFCYAIFVILFLLCYFCYPIFVILFLLSFFCYPFFAILFLLCYFDPLIFLLSKTFIVFHSFNYEHNLWRLF
jgi:hypothetical protein